MTDCKHENTEERQGSVFHDFFRGFGETLRTVCTSCGATISVRDIYCDGSEEIRRIKSPVPKSPEAP